MKRNEIEYRNDDNRDLVLSCIDCRQGYICDAISETADCNVEIYTRPLLEWATDNYDYCDEACKQGFVDFRDADNILVRIAQAGQYQYYSDQLYDEITAIVLEYAFEYLKTDEIPDDLAELLESKARNYDKFSEIEADCDEYNNEHNDD